MLIGVPKEIKNHEYRVGLSPACVRELRMHEHKVIVESGCGQGIGFTDEDYIRAGASIAPQARDVFDQAELVIKVKEPHPSKLRAMKIWKWVYQSQFFD